MLLLLFHEQQQQPFFFAAIFKVDKKHLRDNFNTKQLWFDLNFNSRKQ